MKLVDRSGSVVDVPEDDAHAAVQSGQYGWVQGEPVHVVTADGTVGQVAAEDANAELARGARLAKPEEVRAAQLQARHGGIGGTLAAGAEGFGRGLTLGGSDAVAPAIAGAFGGDEEAVRTHLEEEQEAHPYAAGAGQLLGAVAPILATDGAAAPEEIGALGSLGARAAAGETVRALGAIPRAVNAAGEFAEGVTAKLLGTEAEGVLGKAAQSAVKQSARAIVEGGIWDAGDEVSESSLKNEPLTAEKLLAHIGHGALFTGAVGASLGAFGSLGTSAIEKAADLASGPMADEQLIRSLNTNKKSLITDAKERFGSLEPVAERIRSDIGVEAGDAIEDIAKKATAADAKAIEGLQESVEKVGATGVRVGSVVEALETRAAEFDRKLGLESAANAVRKQVENLKRIYEPIAKATGVPIEDVGVPIQHLLEQRRTLEGTINWSPLADKPTNQGLKAAGRTIEDAIMNAGDEAAAKSGVGAGAWKQAYQEAKRRFSEVRWIKDVTDDALDAKMRNNSWSPSDKAAAFAGMAGGLAGHGVGGGVLGLAGGLVNHVIRERGNTTAAVLLDKLSTFDGISQATRDMGDRVTTAIAAALRTRTSEPSREDFSEARFAREHERISKLASMTPAAVTQHMEEQTSQLAAHAPGLAKELAAKTKAAQSYVESKLPAPSDAPTMTPQLTKATKASSQARAEFLRAVDAVEGGPPYVLRKLARGTMTLDDAEAMHAVYPAWFAEMQTEVLDACSDRTKPVPLQTAMRFGLLFDVPTCPELDPAFLQAQAANAPKEKPPAGEGAPKKSHGRPSANVNIAENAQSTFERASA